MQASHHAAQASEGLEGARSLLDRQKGHFHQHHLRHLFKDNASTPAALAARARHDSTTHRCGCDHQSSAAGSSYSIPLAAQRFDPPKVGAPLGIWRRSSLLSREIEYWLLLGVLLCAFPACASSAFSRPI